MISKKIEATGDSTEQFLAGKTYLHTIQNNGIKTVVEIYIYERTGCFAFVQIDGKMRDIAAIIRDGDEEFMLFHISWPFSQDKIYPSISKY
jgi:hypothetical protein